MLLICRNASNVCLVAKVEFLLCWSFSISGKAHTYLKGDTWKVEFHDGRCDKYMKEREGDRVRYREIERKKERG